MGKKQLEVLNNNQSKRNDCAKYSTTNKEMNIRKIYNNNHQKKKIKIKKWWQRSNATTRPLLLALRRITFFGESLEQRPLQRSLKQRLSFTSTLILCFGSPLFGLVYFAIDSRTSFFL